MAEYEYTYQGDEGYCYPGTNVLRNKENIREHGALMVAEREITSLKLLMLREKPMRGQYGFSHLRAIHRFLLFLYSALAGCSCFFLICTIYRHCSLVLQAASGQSFETWR